MANTYIFVYILLNVNKKVCSTNYLDFMISHAFVLCHVSLSTCEYSRLGLSACVLNIKYAPLIDIFDFKLSSHSMQATVTHINVRKKNTFWS